MKLIPENISYKEFTAMTVKEQQALLAKQYQKPDCSSNNITYECIVFKPMKLETEQEQAEILSKKHPETMLGWDALSETGKLLLSSYMRKNTKNED